MSCGPGVLLQCLGGIPNWRWYFGRRDVFIKHMPYSVYGKPEESFDYLLIGAVKDGNYEVVGYTLMQ